LRAWGWEWRSVRSDAAIDNTNYGQAVAGIVVKDNKVLLVRHTYGAGRGKLIIPGGYVNHGESPQEALKRELLEETGISANPGDIVGVRFNVHDWYIAFRADYIGGTARSDGNENSEAVWIGIEEIAARGDIPELTKKLVQAACGASKTLIRASYEGDAKYAPCSLYCV
jgi:ADP-ribose pyrophosphatase YjhB (NUDIX family)